MTTINESINKKILDFKALIEGLNSLTDNRKILWLDVYTNALQDRDYALQMYTHLSGFVIGDAQQHALHGPNIAKYLERMGKANDQLLKLAELVNVAIEKHDDSETITADDLYKSFATDEVLKSGSKR